MTHVFIAPHPDDVALSCGGLIGSLRELGQNVAIVTVFSGAGGRDELTPYQREALGFGSKANWPDTMAFNRASLAADYPIDENDPTPPWAAEGDRLEATQADADAAAKRFWQRSSWYRRASIHNQSLAGQVLADDVPTQGAVLTTELTDAEAANDLMATRRLEDERYAYFAEGSVVFLDLPDAVFRGYEGDEELLAAPRADDTAPAAILRREVARLEPQKVYFPLGIGGHVDHQLVREVGLELLVEARELGDAGARLGGDRLVLRGLPVRLVERVQPALGPRRRRPRPAARGRLDRPRVRRHQRSARVEDQRDLALRQPARSPLRRPSRDGRDGPLPRPPGRRPRWRPGRRRALLGLDPPVGSDSRFGRHSGESR